MTTTRRFVASPNLGAAFVLAVAILGIYGWMTLVNSELVREWMASLDDTPRAIGLALVRSSGVFVAAAFAGVILPRRHVWVSVAVACVAVITPSFVQLTVSGTWMWPHFWWLAAALVVAVLGGRVGARLQRSIGGGSTTTGGT